MAGVPKLKQSGPVILSTGRPDCALAVLEGVLFAVLGMILESRSASSIFLELKVPYAVCAFVECGALRAFRAHMLE